MPLLLVLVKVEWYGVLCFLMLCSPFFPFFVRENKFMLLNIQRFCIDNTLIYLSSNLIFNTIDNLWHNTGWKTINCVDFTIVLLFSLTVLHLSRNIKNKIKKELRRVNITLKSALSIIFYNCLIHQINIASKSKQKAITKRHIRKLDKFPRILTPTNIKLTLETPCTIFQWRTWILQMKNMKNIKHCRLDWIIVSLISPLITQSKQILRCFIKTFCPNFPHIPGNQLAELKSKFRNACHKYNNIKVSYKF